jgi:hypothetical protein
MKLESMQQSRVSGMDEAITRIMEIERQCSAEIERAELESAKRIEAHRRLFEENIARFDQNACPPRRLGEPPRIQSRRSLDPQTRAAT